MANTVTATLIGKHSSVARGVVATHSPGSPEVLTIPHRLTKAATGYSSNYLFRPQLRTAQAFGGGPQVSTDVQSPPYLALRTWNDSVAIFDGVGFGYAVGSPFIATFDIICEDTHEMIT